MAEDGDSPARQLQEAINSQAVQDQQVDAGSSNRTATTPTATGTGRVQQLGCEKSLDPPLILVQLSYTFMYFVTEAAFNRGLNPYVYVTYRHLLVAVILWPFAYYHDKKLRPKMTWKLFLEIFVLSLLGVSLTLNSRAWATLAIYALWGIWKERNRRVFEGQETTPRVVAELLPLKRQKSLTLNMYFASLKYTSPTFVSSMLNTVASITFVVAIVLRMEIVDVKTPRGRAKIAGTAVSFAGATIMTLYKGAAITSPYKAPVRIPGSQDAATHDGRLKGSILAVGSCVCWSIWYIMQATSVKRYPADLSLTAWMATVGGVQSLAFAVVMHHRKEDWLVGFGLNFWCIIYSGIACSGFAVFAQLWCTNRKGPVFVTMFNPVSTIMVAVLAYFIFGENLYVGSIIGGVVVIAGLYMLLWGKDKDQEYNRGDEEEQEGSGDLEC